MIAVLQKVWELGLLKPLRKMSLYNTLNNVKKKEFWIASMVFKILSYIILTLIKIKLHKYLNKNQKTSKNTGKTSLRFNDKYSLIKY